MSAAATIEPDWWKGFHDPYLDTLIAKAIAGNFDIKVLAARIDVAGTQIGEAKAGALPTMDLGAGADFEKTTGQTFAKQYNVATQVNWDIDIWGKVEKGVQAQKAEFHASEADWRAGYLELVANVSSTYFQILQFDDQIDQQQKTLVTNRQILTIYDGQRRNGLVPQTQVLRQQAEINRLTNRVARTAPLARCRQQRALHADRRAGGRVSIAQRPFAATRATAARCRTACPRNCSRGVPTWWRPSSECWKPTTSSARPSSRNCRPSASPAHGGTASFALTDLLKSFTFGFMPSINIPLLDPGVRAHVKVTQAQSTVAEQQYRVAVMGAFEEVENALVNLNSHKAQRVELQQQVSRLQIVADQIQSQLRLGVVSQLEVFETERTLLEAQQDLLANHQLILSDTVLLYKALGGGWPSVDVQAKWK